MAEDDLSFARLELREHFHAKVCFLSQQTVEKCLKAWLLAESKTAPRTHKIIELVSLCTELTAELSPLKTDLKLLDEFYMPTRYPDAIPGSLPEGLPSEEDARQAFIAPERAYRMVRDHIAL